LARAKTGMMKKVERGDSLQPYVGGRLQPRARVAATAWKGERLQPCVMEAGCSLA
jgi:hypothetical protein